MSKPLTRTQINEKKFRRINDKSLRQLLIHRFLNDYGYDKGEVTATAIVDDILRTVEDYFVITLPLEKLATGDSLPEERYLSYGHLVWMAVPLEEYPERGKSIVKTRMKPVILTYLAAEDMESFRNGFTSRQLRINRWVRWCHQAYDQGALLTQLDLVPSCSTSVIRSSVITSMSGKKPRAKSYPLVAIFMTYPGRLPTRKRLSRSIFKGISPRLLLPRPSTPRRRSIDIFGIMSL